MTPLRVKWTEPDKDRRTKAREQIGVRDANDLRHGWNAIGPSPADPDLNAVIEHTGILLTEPVFVPGHLKSGATVGGGVCYNGYIPPEWKCLVATATETIEMDPRRLVVVGLWDGWRPRAMA